MVSFASLSIATINKARTYIPPFVPFVLKCVCEWKSVMWGARECFSLLLKSYSLLFPFCFSLLFLLCYHLFFLGKSRDFIHQQPPTCRWQFSVCQYPGNSSLSKFSCIWQVNETRISTNVSRLLLLCLFLFLSQFSSLSFLCTRYNFSFWSFHLFTIHLFSA